jgi:hypothetical protein
MNRPLSKGTTFVTSQIHPFIIALGCRVPTYTYTYLIISHFLWLESTICARESYFMRVWGGPKAKEATRKRALDASLVTSVLVFLSFTHSPSDAS